MVYLSYMAYTGIFNTTLMQTVRNMLFCDTNVQMGLDLITYPFKLNQSAQISYTCLRIQLNAVQTKDLEQISTRIHVISLKGASGRFFFHFSEVFEKCIARKDL